MEVKDKDQGAVYNEDAMQVVCFRLANEEYAIDITRIQEVIRVPKITPVPQMPDFVLGVINIRGNVVPVFDLRKRLDIAETEFTNLTKVLVLNMDGELISMIVDEVLDNITIDKSKIDPPPSVKMHIERECIKGVGVLENRMISILDIDMINQVINREIELARS